MMSSNKLTKREALALYKNMLRIRLAEEMIAKKYSEGEIRLGIHLCIGQEAIAAGVCENLQKGDYIFSNHRSHGHYIAGNGDLPELFAELYGKASGCSSGKGGSMHLFDGRIGYLGSSSIVGGNTALAVGTALASKYFNLPRVTVCFVGDGTVDEGTFYEALSFAALKELPVLFVCENNFYAIFSHIKARQKYDNIYRRYREIGVPGKRIDGNDPLKVYEVSKRLIEEIRNEYGEGGPLSKETHNALKKPIETLSRAVEELSESLFSLILQK